MVKILSLVMIGLLLFSVIVISGCVVNEEQDHGMLTTKKTTTSVGINGIKTETKNCPLWDRDC